MRAPGRGDGPLAGAVDDAVAGPDGSVRPTAERTSSSSGPTVPSVPCTSAPAAASADCVPPLTSACALWTVASTCSRTLFSSSIAVCRGLGPAAAGPSRTTNPSPPAAGRRARDGGCDGRDVGPPLRGGEVRGPASARAHARSRRVAGGVCAACPSGGGGLGLRPAHERQRAARRSPRAPARRRA